MKSICITGTDNNTLEQIAAPFYGAGLEHAAPLMRERKMTLEIWHQKTLKAHKSRTPMGKMWDELAIDLLLANIESPCWGWHSALSVEALDYWADLEPNIHFLLVCNRPEEELMAKISDIEPDDALVAGQDFLTQWVHRHEKMLQFYLANPERCLLIDGSDALRHLGSQLVIAHQHWKLPFTSEALKTDAGRNLEKFIKVPEAEARKASDTPADSLSRLIVREIIKASKADIVSFYSELRAAQYPLADFTERGEDLFHWLRRDLSQELLNDLFFDYQKLICGLKKSQEQLSGQRRNLEGRIETLEKEISEYQAAEDGYQKKICGLKESQEQLSGQRDNLEGRIEILEKEISEYQETENSVVGMKGLLNQKSQENELIHREMEQLREVSIKGVEIKNIKKENELLALQLAQAQEELERYFSACQKLRKSEREHEAEKRQMTLQVAQLQEELSESGQWMNFFKRRKTERPKLTFDKVSLRREQKNPDYEHLHIDLHNISYGKKNSTLWGFRLSCANVRPGKFGEHPKLELPKQREELLSGWFPENEDDFGEKLELRFALPKSMDTSVWRRMARSDQQLIKDLLDRVPTILCEVEDSGRTLSRDWNDWKELADNMARILKMEGGSNH